MPNNAISHWRVGLILGSLFVFISLFTSSVFANQEVYVTEEIDIAPGINGIPDEFVKGSLLELTSATGESLAYRILYDDKNLYIGLEAEDEYVRSAFSGASDKDDSFEIFFGSDQVEPVYLNSNSGLGETNRAGLKGAAWVGTLSSSEIEGWNAELAIPWTSLGLTRAPSPGDAFRFNIVHHDRSISGTTDIVWQNTDGGSYRNDDGWGVLVIKEKGGEIQDTIMDLYPEAEPEGEPVVDDVVAAPVPEEEVLEEIEPPVIEQSLPTPEVLSASAQFEWKNRWHYFDFSFRNNGDSTEAVTEILLSFDGPSAWFDIFPNDGSYVVTPDPGGNRDGKVPGTIKLIPSSPIEPGGSLRSIHGDMDGRGNDIIDEVPLSIVVTYENGDTLRGVFDKEANGWVFNQTLETSVTPQVPPKVSASAIFDFRGIWHYFDFTLSNSAQSEASVTSVDLAFTESTAWFDIFDDDGTFTVDPDPGGNRGDTYFAITLTPNEPLAPGASFKSTYGDIDGSGNSVTTSGIIERTPLSITINFDNGMRMSGVFDKRNGDWVFNEVRQAPEPGPEQEIEHVSVSSTFDMRLWDNFYFHIVNDADSDSELESVVLMLDGTDIGFDWFNEGDGYTVEPKDFTKDANRHNPMTLTFDPPLEPGKGVVSPKGDMDGDLRGISLVANFANGDTVRGTYKLVNGDYVFNEKILLSLPPEPEPIPDPVPDPVPDPDPTPAGNEIGILLDVINYWNTFSLKIENESVSSADIVSISLNLTGNTDAEIDQLPGEGLFSTLPNPGGNRDGVAPKSVTLRLSTPLAPGNTIQTTNSGDIDGETSHNAGISFSALLSNGETIDGTMTKVEEDWVYGNIDRVSHPDALTDPRDSRPDPDPTPNPTPDPDPDPTPSPDPAPTPSPTVGGKAIPTNGSTYFVSPNGNNSNNGRSPNQAWKTLAKVNSSVNTTGADVYLLAGGVWHDQVLHVDWRGTASNRAIIGCYYMDGGTPRTCKSSHKKPEINGNLTPQCVAARNCKIDHDELGFKGAVPSGHIFNFPALIEIYEDYVTIQSLSVQHSASVGIALKQAASWTQVFDSDLGWAAQHVFRAAVNSKNTHLRNNVIHHGVICDRYQSNSAFRACAIDGAGGGGGHPPTVSLCTRSAPCGALMENNRVYSSYGEGVSMIQGTHAHVIGNVFSDNRAACVLLDGFDWGVVEGNICYDDTNGDFGYGGNTIRPTLEGRGPKSNWYDNANSVFRNNLIVNIDGKCFNAGIFGGVSSQGFKIGYRYFGNTCINPRSNFAAEDSRPTGVVLPSSALKNNIIYAPNVSKAECKDNAPTNTYDNNFWHTSGISASACKDGGDQYGVPQLRTSLNKTYTRQNPPKLKDFGYVSGSAKGVNDGVVLNKKILNASQFPLFNAVTFRNFSRSLWEQENAYDALGKVRGSNPDIGAIEY